MCRVVDGAAVPQCAVKFGSIIFCFCTIHFLSLIDSFQPYPCTSKNQIWRDNKKRKENRNTLNFTWFLMINQTKAYFTKCPPFLLRPFYNYGRLLDKPYENEVTLTGQNQPLKCWHPLEPLKKLKRGIDL